MEKLARFIVSKWIVFIVLFALLCFGCVVTSNWTKVCDELTAYLNDSTETRMGLDISDEEFVTYGTARVMFSNVTLDQTEGIANQLESIKGVKKVEYDETTDHYKNASMLYDVTFEGGDLDEVSISALDEIYGTFDDYDMYVSTEVGNPVGQTLDKEMKVVLIITVIIICLVLIFTSRTWAEIPVLLITFGAAALLNKGTNFIFGEISFITDSIAVVLQLGLAIDYAIIMCHRYTEEREFSEPKIACEKALAKAIPEISASSLTTISGLLALAFMDFGIGLDMSRVLIKAIVLSLMSVFFLMPALLVVAAPWIDKTHHKSFVPNIETFGKFSIKTRFIIPPAFLIVLIVAFVLSGKCPYVYGYENLDTLKQNDIKIAEKKIESIFPSDNLLALIIPAGDYESEAKLIKELEALPGVDHCTGLSGTEVKDGYMVTTAVNPREFSEIADIDVEAARVLYGAYCVDKEEYGQLINNLDQCKVPIIDVFKFLHDTVEEGYVTLSDEQQQSVDELYETLTDGEKQLSGEKHARILLYLNMPEESDETYQYLNTIRSKVGQYYTKHYLIGETTKCLDLKTSFQHDNNMITILSIFFVILVLLLTFKSVGLPLLLILVIQGSIYINFSFPYIMQSNMFFLAYLIVSAIQMGANIDYAIVISSRYLELKKEMPYKKAMCVTINQAFPTVLTSGSILMAAGTAIALLSSENTVSLIGVCLGRGTLISMILVLGVLPQILLLGDSLIEKTHVNIGGNINIQRMQGAMRINGRVRGYISGYIDADIKGVMTGEFNAMISNSTTVELDEDSLKDIREKLKDTADDIEINNEEIEVSEVENEIY